MVDACLTRLLCSKEEKPNGQTPGPKYCLRGVTTGSGCSGEMEATRTVPVATRPATLVVHKLQALLSCLQQVCCIHIPSRLLEIGHSRSSMCLLLLLTAIGISI